MKSLRLTLYIALFFYTLSCQLPEQAIQACLQSTATATTIKNLPPDISFLCADLKYKDGELKFCECAEAIYMDYTRDARIDITGMVYQFYAPGWEILWHYLKQFNLPIWYVGNRYDEVEMSIQTLFALSGTYRNTIQDLENDQIFQALCNKPFTPSNNIKDYHGLVVYHTIKKNYKHDVAINNFKKRYPNVIVVNGSIGKFLLNKASIYSTFTQAGLRNLVPYTKIYTKIDPERLTQKIINDFTAPFLIIKPLAGSCSKGVSMIERDICSDLVERIVNKKILSTDSIGFSYWLSDKKNMFVVSDYAPSKTIYKAGKAYDPTMRIMFLLHHNAGKLYTTIIGGFWKIPIKSLEDKSCLTDKHITTAHLHLEDPDEFYSGILVNQEDMSQVKTILHQSLPKLYEYVLASYKN